MSELLSLEHNLLGKIFVNTTQYRFCPALPQIMLSRSTKNFFIIQCGFKFNLSEVKLNTIPTKTEVNLFKKRQITVLILSKFYNSKFYLFKFYAVTTFWSAEIQLSLLTPVAVFSIFFYQTVNLNQKLFMSNKIKWSHIFSKATLKYFARVGFYETILSREQKFWEKTFTEFAFEYFCNWNYRYILRWKGHHSVNWRQNELFLSELFLLILFNQQKCTHFLFSFIRIQGIYFPLI